ncbi:MAG: FecR domain-containing protein [Pseudomonadota bacterium]
MQKNKVSLDTQTQAFEWYSKVICNDLQDDEDVQLEQWLDKSEENRKAYQHAQYMWADLGQLDLTDYSAPVEESTFGSLKQKLPLLRDLRVFYATATCVLLFLVIVSTELVSQFRGVSSEIYFTEVAELKEINLADGTIITLGAQTKIEVVINDYNRKVHLHAGEAYFDVQSAPDRPFYVLSDGIRVQVAGTEFVVSKRKKAIKVSVSEGEVVVAQTSTLKNDDVGSYVFLQQGEAVSANRKYLAKIESIDENNIGAWRFGELVYVDTSLDEIIDDLKRYYDKPIRILDEKAKKLFLSLVHESDDIDDLLSLLESTLPINIEQTNQGSVLISYKKSKKVSTVDNPPTSF